MPPVYPPHSIEIHVTANEPLLAICGQQLIAELRELISEEVQPLIECHLRSYVTPKKIIGPDYELDIRVQVFAVYDTPPPGLAFEWSNGSLVWFKHIFTRAFITCGFAPPERLIDFDVEVGQRFKNVPLEALLNM